MYISVDRFEGDFAICECKNLKIIKILKSKLPADVHEGDVLDIDEKICVIDSDETLRKKREIYQIQEDLFSK